MDGIRVYLCRSSEVFTFTILARIPSPAIISQALQEVKPVIMIAVPLVIEKIIRKKGIPKDSEQSYASPAEYASN